MKKGLLIAAGIGIVAVVGNWIRTDIVPIFKKHKQVKEECELKIKEVQETAEKEKLRHEEAMRQIKEEGDREIQEMRDKSVNRACEFLDKLKKIQEEDLGIKHKPDIRTLKYKDKDGIVHEFDGFDREKFREVMNDRTNTLVFD